MWESNSGKLPSDELEEARRRGAVSAREDQYRLAGTSQAANSGTTQRNSRWRHDDIPKEKIISIFNTEMAKLREQESNLERAIASRSFGTNHVRRVRWLLLCRVCCLFGALELDSFVGGRHGLDLP